MNTRYSPLAQEWIYGTVRTILISYGVAAFAFLSSRTTPDVPTLSTGLVILGLGAQVLLLVVRLLIKRLLPGRASAVQAMIIVELIGDGVTVLLFALGTLGPIIHAADNV